MPKPLPSAMWIQVTSQRRFHPSFWDWSISISLPFPTLDFSSFKRTTTTKTHVGFSTGFCGFLLVWYQISFSQQKIARNRRLTLSSQKKSWTKATRHRTWLLHWHSCHWLEQKIQSAFFPSASLGSTEAFFSKNFWLAVSGQFFGKDWRAEAHSVSCPLRRHNWW